MKKKNIKYQILFMLVQGVLFPIARPVSATRETGQHPLARLDGNVGGKKFGFGANANYLHFVHNNQMRSLQFPEHYVVPIPGTVVRFALVHKDHVAEVAGFVDAHTVRTLPDVAKERLPPETVLSEGFAHDRSYTAEFGEGKVVIPHIAGVTAFIEQYGDRLETLDPTKLGEAFIEMQQQLNGVPYNEVLFANIASPPVIPSFLVAVGDGSSIFPIGGYPDTSPQAYSKLHVFPDRASDTVGANYHERSGVLGELALTGDSVRRQQKVGAMGAVVSIAVQHPDHTSSDPFAPVYTEVPFRAMSPGDRDNLSHILISVNDILDDNEMRLADRVLNLLSKQSIPDYHAFVDALARDHDVDRRKLSVLLTKVEDGMEFIPQLLVEETPDKMVAIPGVSRLDKTSKLELPDLELLTDLRSRTPFYYSLVADELS